MQQLLCDCLGVAPDELRELMTLTPAGLMQSEAAGRARDATTLSILRATLPEAQQQLKHALPSFYDWLRRELGITAVPMSADHAIEWFSDFLLGRQTIDELLMHHAVLSADDIEQATPHFIAAFDGFRFGRAEWQQATALLCLALLAGLRQKEAGQA